MFLVPGLVAIIECPVVQLISILVALAMDIHQVQGQTTMPPPYQEYLEHPAFPEVLLTALPVPLALVGQELGILVMDPATRGQRQGPASLQICHQEHYHLDQGL